MNEKPYCGKPNMQDDYVIMYFRIRQGIGVLGMLLPFLCPLAVLLFGKSAIWQPSISHYYYSVAHIVFVGILIVIGALLVAYRGRSKTENWLCNVLGLLAFGVAIFPTSSTDFIIPDQAYISLVGYSTWINTAHVSCAITLLLGFAIYCLSYFQCQDPKVDRAPQDNPRKKKLRNRIYKICGWSIIISLIFAAFYFNSSEGNFFGLSIHPVYFFETTALVAFGFAWLVKGSVLWFESRSRLVRKMYYWFR